MSVVYFFPPTSVTLSFSYMDGPGDEGNMFERPGKLSDYIIIIIINNKNSSINTAMQRCRRGFQRTPIDAPMSDAATKWL